MIQPMTTAASCAMSLVRAICAVAVGAVHLLCAGQSRPLEFTFEERSQFVDRSHKQSRVELPLVAHNAGAAGWLDATHVVYSTREIVGVWKARTDEMAKVVVFDVEKRTVAETEYRGNLVCFTPDRMLVSEPSTPPSPGFSAAMGDRLLAGRFGGPLLPVLDTKYKDILPFNCTLNPVAVAPDRDAPTEVPLREGDGLLRIPRGSQRLSSAGSRGYQLLDSKGQVVQTFSGTGYPLAAYLYYLPWLRAYFSDKGSLGPSEIVRPDGWREVVVQPALIASFTVAHHVGSAAPVPSRVGILWNLVTWRGFWRMQGLYLHHPAGALERVDDGHIPAQPRPEVSIDGCRLFYLRRAGDPLNPRVPFVPTVLNVCEGVQK